MSADGVLRRPGLPLRRPPAPLTDGVVHLDAPTDEDLDAIVASCDDAAAARWLSLPSPYTERDAREWLERSARAEQEGDSVQFALREAGSRRYVGSIALAFGRCRAGEAEIGYLVARSARGRGVARRAVRLVADWGLQEYGVRRIEILVRPGNVASRRVAEGVGAIHEGVRRNGLAYGDGEVADAVVFALVAAGVARRGLPLASDG